MANKPANGFSFFALPDNRQLQVWLGNNGQIEFGRRNALGLAEDTAEYLETAGPE